MEEGDDLRTKSFRDEDYNTRRAFLTSYPLHFDKEEDHQETQAHTPATTQSYRVDTGEKKKEKMKNIIVEWAGGRAMVLRRSDISWTGAYDRHSFGSLVSSDIILRGVLLSFFSIFRVSHWGQCEVQVWGGG
ncbi:hypothetical protein HanOQP8_Chr12g0449271 [Helianthus annuus]|nr:hypothetical protein HanOQP8_Chr12g0449271 [Helianthus annuus]